MWRERAIPSLDGLRAVSILLVIVSHSSSLWESGTAPAAATAYGDFGVRVFFVISGFLITSLLIREQEKVGSVRLRRFWFRRTLRISPPYFAFLAVIAFLFARGMMGDGPARWWPALTYTSNYFPTGAWLTGHTWSLSVEEQFYLCWPLVIARTSRTTALRVAGGVIVAAPVVRVALFALTRDYDVARGWDFDFIAAGCALALAAPMLAKSQRWNSLLRSWWLGAGFVALLAVHLALRQSHRWLFVGEIFAFLSAEALVLTVVVAWCVERPGTAIGRVLNAAPVRWLGIISYSVYLWQQLFFRPHAPWPRFATAAAALCAAILSFYLVERPSLRLRGWLERWWESRSV